MGASFGADGGCCCNAVLIVVVLFLVLYSFMVKMLGIMLCPLMDSENVSIINCLT